MQANWPLCASVYLSVNWVLWWYLPYRVSVRIKSVITYVGFALLWVQTKPSIPGSFCGCHMLFGLRSMFLPQVLPGATPCCNGSFLLFHVVPFKLSCLASLSSLSINQLESVHRDFQGQHHARNGGNSWEIWDLATTSQKNLFHEKVKFWTAKYYIKYEEHSEFMCV